jgi:hypothetical protein
MNTMTALFHDCKQGNCFGLYAEEPMSCRVCRQVETLPTLRNIYTAETPLELCEITRVDRDTFPMLVGYEVEAIGGRF